MQAEKTRKQALLPGILCVIAAIVVVAVLTVGKTDAQTEGCTFPAASSLPFPQNAGQDALYNFDVKALSAAPAGYKPLFIEHYGRHGSRYAYSQYFYSDVMDALKAAEENSCLTPRGKALLEDYSRHFDHYTLHMGELCEVGWRQQQQIARVMYRSFPDAFNAKDAYAYACASSSMRSVMSMAGFCTGLQSEAPGLDIYAQQSKSTLGATLPRDKNNPFFTPRVEEPWPFEETVDEFQSRKLDSRAIVQRLFTGEDKILKGKNLNTFVRNMYVMVIGMNSLKEEERTDFSGIFTDEELETLNEVQNYRAGHEWWPYGARSIAVVEDIIADADERLACGKHGVKARFGHDHVALPVLRLLGVNHYGDAPTTPDRFTEIFNVDDSPMGCNFQIVFYASKSPQKPILVKVLLNGVEGTFDTENYKGPYYRWDNLREYLKERIDRYPVKNK